MPLGGTTQLLLPTPNDVKVLRVTVSTGSSAIFYINLNILVLECLSGGGVEEQVGLAQELDGHDQLLLADGDGDADHLAFLKQDQPCQSSARMADGPA